MRRPLHELPDRTHYARQLRRNATDAEARLWSEVRRSLIGGLRFYRQAPVGPYTVDFLCREAALVIELDGAQHGDARVPDERRSRYLAACGLRVLRFWNNEVSDDMEQVLEAIWDAVRPALDAREAKRSSGVAERTSL